MNPALLPVVVLLATAAPAPPPADAGLRSYVRARQVLDAGIAAHGGPAALLGVRSVRRQLTGGWTNPFQGPRPSALVGPSLAIPPILFPDELLSFVDYAAGRWYERLEESNYSGDHVTQVDAIDGETGFDALAYFDEKPIYRAFDAAEVRATRSEKLRRYPEGALRMALTRPETLQWVGEDEELRRRQQVISLTDPAGTRVLLSFDAASGLLTKTAWLREHAVAGDTYGENLYLDYRRVGGLMLPFHYVDRVGGLAWQHFTASAIALDVDVPAESFQPPRDVAPAQRDPDERTVEPLGGDAYLVRGAYNTLFVGFDDHVVVLEAPRDSAYSEQVMELIARTLPGKPIRSLIATHFHSDHLGGIRPFVAAGVPILTTADAKPVIERVAASSRRLHPDAQSRAPRAPRIETITGSRVLADAHHRLELYDVGPTAHAAQILVAYLPEQRLLFEADLLDVTAPEMVLAGPDGVTLAQKIAALGLDVARIVPVHGVPATREHLEQALAVRARHVPPG